MPANIEAMPQLDSDESRDHVVVFSGVPWSTYESLLRARGEGPRPRLAYLDGTLEIMTTSMPHELDKKLLGRLVEAYAEERDIELNGGGNATFRKKVKKVGLEPDECYWVGTVDERAPHFAIEIVHSSGGIDKLEIYRRLGVREVWFWLDGAIAIFVLEEGRYGRVTEGLAVPGIDIAHLSRLITTPNYRRQTSMVRAYRRSLKRRS